MVERINSICEKTYERHKMGRLYDKNSDIQYAPRQLIPKSYYEQHFERREDNRAIKFRKMLDGVKKKLKK